MDWVDHSRGFVDSGEQIELVYSPAAGENDRLPDIPEKFLVEVFAALGNMALRSKHRQADVAASLRHAAIDAPRSLQMAAVRHIEAKGWVDKVVPLSDGGVLLSLTALGLEVLAGLGMG